MSVPEIVIVPTAIAFLPEAIDTLLNVCTLVIKKVEDRLDDDTDFVNDLGQLAEDQQPKLFVNKKDLIEQIKN